MAKKTTSTTEKSVENIGEQEQVPESSNTIEQPVPVPAPDPQKEEKPLTSYDVVSLLIKAYSTDKGPKSATEFQQKFKLHLNQIVNSSPIADKHHFLVLFDNLTLK